MLVVNQGKVQTQNNSGQNLARSGQTWPESGQTLGQIWPDSGTDWTLGLFMKNEFQSKYVFWDQRNYSGLKVQIFSYPEYKWKMSRLSYSEKK